MGSPRFIIIDPSETTHISHNYSYNKRLAEMAAANGYKPILLTNVVDDSRHAGIDHRKVFPHTIYQHGEAVRPVKGDPPGLLRWLYNASGDVQVQLSRSLDGLHTERNAATVGLLKLVPALVDVGRHATLGVVMALWRHALQKSSPFNKDVFAEKLAGVLAELQLRPGDKLLVHTASYGLIESFFEVSGRLFPNHYFDCDAYFVFHMSVSAPDSRTYMDRYYSFSRPETLERRMRTGMPFARCHLFATNEPLRAEMREFFLGPVRLWDHLSAPELFNDRLERSRALQGDPDAPFHLGVRASDITRDNVADLVQMARQLKTIPEVRFIVAAKSGGALNEHAVRFLGECADPKLFETQSFKAFFDFLQDLNALILPYSTPVYARRLSGMIFDALCVGVPTIVPAGTTLAAEPSAAVRPYASLARAAGIVDKMRRELAADPPAAREAIRAASKRAQAHTFRDPFLHDFADHHPPTVAVQKTDKVAVQVLPSWPRCGSTLAFNRQVDELMESGYFVAQAFISDTSFHSPKAASWVFRLLYENSSISRGHVQRIASPTRLRTLPLRFSRKFRRADVLGQQIQRLATATPKDGRFMRLAKRADVLMVNHVFNWGWADRLPGRRLLDTHDIQAHHIVSRGDKNAVTGQADSFANIFATESGVWKQADHIFMVSEQELKVVETINPASSLLVPYPTARRLPEISQDEYEDFVRRNGLHESFLWETMFDCLILGDGHPGNVDSVAWFLREVFLPYLAPLKKTVVVGGRVGRKVYDLEWTRLPHIFFTDFVDDVDVLRARSRLTVLPDQSGEGISIKFLDAVAVGHPFVASSTALRGLWFDAAGYQPPLTAAAFGADLLEILNDPAALAKRKALAAQIGAVATAPDRFRAQFRRALAAEKGHTPPSVDDVNSSAAPQTAAPIGAV